MLIIDVGGVVKVAVDTLLKCLISLASIMQGATKFFQNLALCLYLQESCKIIANCFARSCMVKEGISDLFLNF